MKMKLFVLLVLGALATGTTLWAASGVVAAAASCCGDCVPFEPCCGFCN